MFFVGQMPGLVENCNIGFTLTPYKCDKCETLHNGTTHRALPVHTTFSDLDHIFKSHSNVEEF